MNRGWKRFLPFLLGFAFSLQTESMASLSVEQPAGAACFCWFRPALLEGNRLRGIPMGVKESRGLKGRESTCWQMLHGGDRHADRRVRAKLSHISSFLSSGKRWMDGKLPTKTFASTISGGVCTDGSDDEFHYPEGSTKFIAECELPTDRGVFRMRAYRYKGAKVVIREGERVLEWTEMEPVVIYKQAKKFVDPVAVRVHDQCYTSEVLGSKRCDCKEQLDLALDYINQFGGALIYMPQEGRGIGLANKVAAYHLQDGGLDTVDANRQLGFGDDERSYECIPYILEDMGIKSIQLMTNNPFKIRQLSELGVTIAGTKPHVVKPNVYNEKYLRAKILRMSHAIEFDQWPSEAQRSDEKESSVVESNAEIAKFSRRAESSRNISAAGQLAVTRAIAAVSSGSPVMILDRESKEGVLVAAAAAVDERSLSVMIKHGDVLLALMGESYDKVFPAGGYEDRLVSIPRLDDFSADRRVEILRSISNGSRAQLSQVMARRVFPTKVEADDSNPSVYHAALQLVRLSGSSDVAVMTDVISSDRMQKMRGRELVEFAVTNGIITMTSSDILEYKT